MAGRILLCFYLLMVTEVATAQIIQTSGKCEEVKKAVASDTRDYPKDWVVVVECSRADFEKAEKALKIIPTRGAFSFLSQRRTYIDATAILRDELADLLNHELLHIRCNCDLGEKSGVIVK